jgi:hypothetical protein
MLVQIERHEIHNIIRGNLSPTNRDPYIRESFDGGMDPQMIYLYCWDVVDEHSPQQKARAFNLNQDSPIYNRRVLIDRINDHAQDIFDGRIEPEGEHFESFEWTRKSFIVILLTHEGWYFPQGDAIVFDETKGQGNHTFFNAFHPRVSVRTSGGERVIPALCFTNWMVDAYGRNLHDNQREEFHYILFASQGVRAVEAAIDPGGTNLGPPVPPP